MAKLIIIIIAAFFSVTAGESQIFHNESRQTDSTALPVIKVIPRTMTAAADENGYITKEVVIINKGVEKLKIEEIKASCKCSSGKMLRNNIYPMQEGKAWLSINTDGLYADARNVEFAFISNARNSPYKVIITVADSIDASQNTKEK
ncbi:MAG: hypothetical protein ACLFQU_11770 [Candidatus Kapaibacterium sp.]